MKEINKFVAFLVLWIFIIYLTILGVRLVMEGDIPSKWQLLFVALSIIYMILLGKGSIVIEIYERGILTRGGKVYILSPRGYNVIPYIKLITNNFVLEKVPLSGMRDLYGGEFECKKGISIFDSKVFYHIKGSNEDEIKESLKKMVFLGGWEDYMQSIVWKSLIEQLEKNGYSKVRMSKIISPSVKKKLGDNGIVIDSVLYEISKT
jgi:hypothetical protein